MTIASASAAPMDADVIRPNWRRRRRRRRHLCRRRAWPAPVRCGRGAVGWTAKRAQSVQLASSSDANSDTDRTGMMQKCCDTNQEGPVIGRRRAMKNPIEMITSINTTALLLLTLLADRFAPHQAQQQQQQQQQDHQLVGSAALNANANAENQLIAEAGSTSHLPCLIGKPLFCGEPYLIAWYRFNTSTRSWTRVEHGGPSPSGGDEDGNNNLGRIKFKWQPQRPSRPPARSNISRPQQAARASGGGGNQLTPPGSQQQAECFGSAYAANGSASAAGQVRPMDDIRLLFECATLSISSLELADEGQYRCEITFSEVLDFDKCPTSTQSRLTVTARPSGPQVFVNGRAPAQLLRNQQPTPPLKEGSQVRLECRSSGGKPAPRIDWLNITATGGGHIIQPMRSSALSRAAQVEATAQSKAAPGPTLVTTSATSFTLSRYELNARFVCVVQPTTMAPAANTNQAATSGVNNNNNAHQYHLSSAATATAPASLARDPERLAALIDSIPMAGAAPEDSGNGGGGDAGVGAPMLAWIKLDVAVKPVSVSLRVQDVASGEALIPTSAPTTFNSNSNSNYNYNYNSNGNGNYNDPGSPERAVYLLQPNRLYAVQCVVEQSRPASQVSWFNRTLPLQVEQVQLDGAPAATHDYELPPTHRAQRAGTFAVVSQQQLGQHRLSSYVRHTALADGSYRTVASLLIGTSYWDSTEELYCRVTNSAFDIDELVKVAPIMLARLYVNYPPSAWLDSDSHAVQVMPLARALSAQSINGRDHAPAVRRMIAVDRNAAAKPIKLNCHLAANPYLAPSALLQVDWFKDGRKIADAGSSSSSSSSSNSNYSNTANEHRHFAIERAAGLHLPAATGAERADGGSRLFSTSSLTIRPPVMSIDSAQYACQWRLMAHLAGAPSDTSTAQDSIQLVVSEGPPSTITIVPVGLLAGGDHNRDGSTLTTDALAELSLTEAHLAELVEGLKGRHSHLPPAQLHCLSSDGLASPETTKFEWVHTDLNNTEHPISDQPSGLVKQALTAEQLTPTTTTSIDHQVQPVAAKLDLRQFVETSLRKQRQQRRQFDNNDSLGMIDAAQAIAGNYTCRANNSHGSISVSLPIKVTGRPLCKLGIGAKYLTRNNELIIELLCNVYSAPLLLETIWFRNNHQAHVNKTSATLPASTTTSTTTTTTTSTAQSSPLISSIKWNVVAVNERQDFQLDDIVSDPSGNFKCIARNSFGFSEPCELNSVDKRTLTAIAATMTTVASSASVAPSGAMGQQTNAAAGANNNGINNRWTLPALQQQQPPPQMQLDPIGGSGISNGARMFDHQQQPTNNNYNLSQSSNANTVQLHQQTTTTTTVTGTGAGGTGAGSGTGTGTGTGTGWPNQLHQWFTSVPKLDILLFALAAAALLWAVIVFVGGRLFGCTTTGNGRLDYSARLPIKMRFQLNPAQSPAPAMLSSSTSASMSKSNQRRRISSSLKSSSWRSNDTTSNSNNTSPSDADLIIGTRATIGTNGPMLFHRNSAAAYATHSHNSDSNNSNSNSNNNNGNNNGKGHHNVSANNNHNNYYANTSTLAAAAAAAVAANNGLIHFGTGPLIGANGCDSQGGDSSEHDMLQSACSSSNYDEFVQQQQLLMQHQQPIYFQNSNSMATLPNSNGNSNSNSNGGGSGTGGAISSNYHRSSSGRHQQQQPPMLKATTTKGVSCRQQGPAIYGHNTLMCVGAGNLVSAHNNNYHNNNNNNNSNTSVPLIDGTQNSSHIQIDHQGTYRTHGNGRHSHSAAQLPGQHQQQLMPLMMHSTPHNGGTDRNNNSNNNNEHIYDDIVYNRMVL